MTRRLKTWDELLKYDRKVEMMFDHLMTVGEANDLMLRVWRNIEMKLNHQNILLKYPIWLN